MGLDEFHMACTEMNDYAEQLAISGILNIPDGNYVFEDVMDDDGLGCIDIPIKVTLGEMTVVATPTRG